MFEQNSPISSINTDEPDKLYRTLKSRVILGLLITSVVVGGLLSTLTYLAEIDHTEEELELQMKLVTAAIGAEINNFKNMSWQIASRSSARQELELFQQGRLSKKQLVSFSSGKLADGIAQSDDIIGIARLDRNGKVVIRVGETFSDSTWHNDFQSAEQQLGIPFEVKAQRIVALSTPIINRADERIGTDILWFRVNSLYSITRKILTERNNAGHSLLASIGSSPPTILFKSGDIGHHMDEHRSLLKQLAEMDKSRWDYTRLGSTELESAAYPIIGTDLLYMYSIHSHEFYSLALWGAAYTGGTALFLALIGSLLIFTLVRPLAGRISVETDSLLAIINENRALLDESSRNASLLQSIVDNSTSIIYIKDLDGRYMMINREYTRVLDLTEDDAIGRTDFQLFPEETARHFVENDRQVIESRQSVTRDEQAVLDGVLHDYIAIKFPLFDSSGEIYAICGISTDITDYKIAQRELEVSNQRFEFAIMASNDGLWDWNLLNDEAFFSPRWKSMLGYEDDELSNTFETWKSLIEPDDFDKTMLLVQSCLDANATSFKTESRMRHKDGHTVYVLSQGLLVRDDTQTPIRFVGTHTDITELHEQQVLLTGDKEALEQLVKDRTVELEEITDYNRALFIKSPIGLALSTFQGELVDVNPAYLDIIGYSEEEAKSLSFWQITPHDYMTQEQEQLVSLEQTGRYGPYEKELMHKEGHRVPVLLNGLTIELQGESLIWSTVEDITQRKEIENALIESEASLAHAQSIAHLGSWSFDITRDRIVWSDETCRIFGMPSGTSVSLEEFTGFLHPDDVDRVKQAWIDALKGGPFDIEHRIIVDGREKWIREQAILSFDDKRWAIRSIGTVQDITELKLAEIATKQALEEARLLANTRSEFLANMSHEIRTPLNALLGLAKIGKRGDSQERNPELFELITDSSEHLVRVVNDILDFSKIEAGKLVIENQPFSIRRSVNNIARLVRNQAEDKELELDIDIAHNVAEWHNGDAMRVEQILLNLLSNAIKFTEQGRVSLKVITYGEQVRFQITDTGIGMSEQQLDSLYDPFRQGDSTTTRRFGGTGLGLTICKQLSELMGGTLDADSELGSGSEFTLSLPLDVTSELLIPLGSSSTSESSRLQGRHILAAEDIEVNRLVLFDLLEQEGANVVFAINGEQAVECFRNQDMPFDVVLMDIQMPRMDGYEATRLIHDMDADMPVIGLTAHALAEERKRCFDAGMVDHVAKPIDSDILVNSIIKNMKSVDVTKRPARAKPDLASTGSSGGSKNMKSVIDEDALQKRYGGRDAMINKLSNTFLRTHSDTSDKIRAAIREEDFESLHQMAHSIKGLSGYLEATELFRISEHAQMMTENHDNKALETCAELANALDRVVDALSHRVG